MPSIAHEGPIEIIRKHPGLAAELARRAAGMALPGEDELDIRLGSADASNVVPAEFTADIVTLVCDKASGKPLLLVIIEPQGRRVEEKELSWPAYLANLREAHRCKSAVLIVICWDETEAGKCRQPIHMGHPGYTLVPVVIGPRSAPDPEGASPWLTILRGAIGAIGAIDLEIDSGRRAVLSAITSTGGTTPDIRSLTTIILAVASAAARRELEALMRTTEFKSDFLDRIEAQGEARGEAKAILKVLKSRGIELTSAQNELIASCTDLAHLDTWLGRALTATSADEVFKD